MRLTRSWYLRYGSSTYQFLLFQKEVVILSKSLLCVLLQNTCSRRRFLRAGLFFHSFFLYPACLYPGTKGQSGNWAFNVSKTVKDFYLASDPKATVQPHEPFSHWSHGFPLPLLHTVVCQTSAWLLSRTGNEWWHPAAVWGSRAETRHRKVQCTQIIKLHFITKHKCIANYTGCFMRFHVSQK